MTPENRRGHAPTPDRSAGRPAVPPGSGPETGSGLPGLLDRASVRGPLLLAAGAGRVVLCPEKDLPGGPRFTARQLDVARLRSTGLTHAQIGARLGIAVQTVRIHLNAVRIRSQAATMAQALQLVADEETAVQVTALEVDAPDVTALEVTELDVAELDVAELDVAERDVASASSRHPHGG